MNTSVRTKMLTAFAMLSFSFAIAVQAGAVPVTSNLVLQYDGSDVTTIGTEVTSWNNQGSLGSEGDAVPRLITARPTRAASALNGHDVVEFAGVDEEVLRTGTFTSSVPQPNMLFMVMEDTGTNSPVVFDGRQGVAGRNFFRPQSNGTFHLYAGTSITGGSGAVKNSPVIYTTRFDEADSTVDVNGALAFSVGPTIGNQAAAAVSIGNSDPNLPGNTSLGLTGQIAEVLFYSTPLNSAEKRIVENYLSSKYNVGGTAIGSNNTLGTVDHYAGDLNTAGDYDVDVFGIGRVDGSNELVTAVQAGFGIEVTGGTLGDDEWVLAGHKLQTNSLIHSDINVGGINNRWERAWFVDQTGSVDVTLSFDFSDAGLTLPANASNFTLLFRANEALNFTSKGLFSQSGDLLTISLTGGELLNGIYTVGFFAPPIPEPNSFVLLGLGCCALLVRRRRERRQSPGRSAPNGPRRSAKASDHADGEETASRRSIAAGVRRLLPGVFGVLALWSVFTLASGEAAGVTIPLNQGLSFQDEGTLDFDDTTLLATQNNAFAPTTTGTVTRDSYATGTSTTFFDAISANFDLAAAGVNFEQIESASLRFFIRNGSGNAFPGQESYQILQGFKNPTNQDVSPGAFGTSFNLPVGAWITEPLDVAWFTSNSFDVTLRLWEAQVDAIELQVVAPPIPEPSTLLLLGLGTLGLVRHARRRRRQRA